MPITPGTRIGNYVIVGPLGSGGMGAVYKAHDPTLQRTVAIKVLAKQDEDASARLLQEARAASALNHPHICTIHEVGEHEGQAFIVMEHVEGKPLSALIPSDGLPPESVIRYGTQIADALAHAHERGIVHRDLKSQNVVITPEGRAKVLDFGLAARMPQADAEAVTKTQEALPHAGMLVGTLAYMAPEVLRGEAATARSDVWALGVLLYEMVSGRLPFGGDTAADVASATLKDAPTSLPSRVSAGLRSIIQKCLAKEPGQRYALAAVVQGALDAIQSDTAVTQPAGIAPTSAARTWRVVSAAIALALIAGGVGYYLRSGPGTAAPPGSSVPRLSNPIQITNAIGVEDYPSWSPDGQFVAYAATETGYITGGHWDIFVAQVGGGPPVNRTADHDGWDSFPTWSPDGRQIAFWSSRNGGGCFIIPTLGGEPRRVMSAAVSAPSRPQWSPDGIQLACHVQPDVVEFVHLETGASRRQEFVSAPRSSGGSSSSGLAWSYDGHFLAFAGTQAILSQVNQIWVKTFQGPEVLVTDPLGNNWSPSWSTDSRTLYFVSSQGGSADLWRQALSETGEPTGTPQQVSTGLDIRHAVLSPDGTALAYSKGRRVANVWRIPILDRPAVWADAEQLTFDQAFIEHLDISRDGASLIVSSDRAGNPDLWALPADGGTMRQVTNHSTPDWGPAWSPDGQQVAFYAFRSGNREIWTIPIDGGAARQLTDNDDYDGLPSWSPDGQLIAFATTPPQAVTRTYSVGVISVDGTALHLITEGASDRWGASWSPDGEWLWFTRFGPGLMDLWRVPSDGGDPEQMWSGGMFPRWSPDGRNVYFIGDGEHSGRLWSVPAEGGTARPLTDLTGRRGTLGPQALATDGEHLYFTWEEDLADIWVMDVVQDEDDGSDD